MSDPLDVERRSYYPAAHSSGGREAPCIAYIVVHDGEVPGGDTGDELIGSWLHNPASSGSAHVAVDDDSTQRFLDDDVEAWGAPPLNDSALHLEQAGYAAWQRADWLKHEAMIERAAWKMADWMKRHSIPAKFLSVADLKTFGANPQSPKGWTTHANVSEAFGQTVHWDPGPNYPLDVLTEKTATFLALPPPSPDEGGSEVPWNADSANGYRSEWNELAVKDDAALAAEADELLALVIDLSTVSRDTQIGKRQALLDVMHARSLRKSLAP